MILDNYPEIRNNPDYINYVKLIEKSKLEKNLIIKEYYELHHIVPKCVGGGNESENLIELLPSDHFKAHLYLYKIFEQVKSKYEVEYKKLSHAFTLMCFTRDVEESEKYYSESRILKAKLASQQLKEYNHLQTKEVVIKREETKRKKFLKLKNEGKSTWYNKAIKTQLENAKKNKELGILTQWDKGAKKCTNTFILNSRKKYGGVKGISKKDNSQIIFKSPLEAAKSLNGHANTIVRAAKGQRNYAYGYIWSFN